MSADVDTHGARANAYFSRAVGAHAMFILGMYRSGTFAAAPAPDFRAAEPDLELFGYRPDSPSGSWEHPALVRLHERVLRHFGSSWDDCRALPDGWHTGPEIRQFRRLVHEIIAREFGNAPLFAVMEPRLCRLLPIWLDVLAARQMHAHCLVVLRDPLAVADSLTAQNGFCRQKGLLLWLRYYLDLERHSRGVPRAFVMHDQFLDDRRAGMVPVSARHGASSPIVDDDVAEDVEGILSPECHCRASGASAPDPCANIPGIVSRTAKTLVSLSKSDDPDSRALMDEIARDLGRASSLYDAVLGDLHAQISHRDEKLRAAEDTLTAREARIEQLQATLAAREAQVGEPETTRPAQACQIKDLRTTLAVREGQVNQLTTSLATREAQIMELGEFIVLLDCRLGEILRSRPWRVGVLVGDAFQRLVPNGLKRPVWNIARAMFRRLPTSSFNEEIIQGSEICNSRPKIYELLENAALRNERRTLRDMDGKSCETPESTRETTRSRDIVETRPPMDVIVCAHAARDDMRNFLTSLVRNADMPFTLHLIDDGPEAETSAFLKSIAATNGNCDLGDPNSPDRATTSP